MVLYFPKNYPSKSPRYDPTFSSPSYYSLTTPFYHLALCHVAHHHHHILASDYLHLLYLINIYWCVTPSLLSLILSITTHSTTVLNLYLGFSTQLGPHNQGLKEEHKCVCPSSLILPSTTPSGLMRRELVGVLATLLRYLNFSLFIHGGRNQKTKK